MIRSSRWLTAVSVLSALVLTAQAEWTLAQAVGWTVWVAWAWPASLDTYVLAALRAGRDRAWALGLMSVSVCGAHALPVLWPHAVPWWVAGGLSIVPPLVAWRVHELMRGVHEVDPVDHQVTHEVDQGHEHVDQVNHPMDLLNPGVGHEVDQGHEPVDHPGPPVTLLTPGVGHYLDQVDRRVTHQVDYLNPLLDHDGSPEAHQGSPMSLPLDHPMTPDDPVVRERVTWAMGQPDVASVAQIMRQFDVSISTAKRARSIAVEIIRDVEG